jgi:hypothetical protein
MNEFVKVTFSSRRSVLVDGAPNGVTNETIVVQRGFHEFSLEPPPDFSPDSQEHPVVATTLLNPLVIAFTAVITEAAPVPAPTRRAAKKRKARKGAARKRAAKRTVRKGGTSKRATKTRVAKKARRSRKR